MKDFVVRDGLFYKNFTDIPSTGCREGVTKNFSILTG